MSDLLRRHADHTFSGRTDRVAEVAILKLTARLAMIALIPLLGWIGLKFDGRVEAVERLATTTAQGLAVEIAVGNAREALLADYRDRLLRLEARRSEVQ